MAREKLISRSMDKLNNRILGLDAIKEGLVLSNGLSAQICTDHIAELQAALKEHFIASGVLDEKRKLIKTLEKKADGLSKKLLAGVINDFGDDSPNVAKIGGTPTSERAKPISAATKAEKEAKKKAKKA